MQSQMKRADIDVLHFRYKYFMAVRTVKAPFHFLNVSSLRILFSLSIQKKDFPLSNSALAQTQLFPDIEIQIKSQGVLIKFVF